jgi:hypothetical protein
VLVARNDNTPRYLRTASDVVTPRALAPIMTARQGRCFGLWRAGGIGRLSTLIYVVQALYPASNQPRAPDT